MEHRAIEGPRSLGSGTKVALLVDGDNVASGFAGQVLTKAGRLGQVIVKRVYLDPHHLTNWERSAGFDLRVVRAGRNAADMHLAIDAVDLSHRRDLGAFVIASSDGGYAPLARFLVERGLVVLGLGQATAPADWRRSCSRFEALALPVPLPVAPKPPAAGEEESGGSAVTTGAARAAPSPDGLPLSTVIPASASLEAPAASVFIAPTEAAEDWVQRTVREAGDAGILLSTLGSRLKLQGITKASLLEGTWQKYLAARSEHYRVDGEGALARVRLARA